eukprot:3223526-Pyramimonas_sp.AAC.1
MPAKVLTLQSSELTLLIERVLTLAWMAGVDKGMSSRLRTSVVERIRANVCVCGRACWFCATP